MQRRQLALVVGQRLVDRAQRLTGGHWLHLARRPHVLQNATTWPPCRCGPGSSRSEGGTTAAPARAACDATASSRIDVVLGRPVRIRPPARDACHERQRSQVDEHVPGVAKHDRVVAAQSVLRRHLDGGFDCALAHPNPYVPGKRSARRRTSSATGQADDVEVVALDPLDESGALPLDRVAARASLPLPARHVPGDVARRQLAERDARHLAVHLLPRRREQRQAGDDFVRPAGQALEHLLGRLRACGLAVDAPVEQTTSVSQPSTGRPSASASTDCALPSACATGSSSVSSYRGATMSNGIRSCPRISRRRGDVEARRSGGAGGSAHACLRASQSSTLGQRRPQSAVTKSYGGGSGVVGREQLVQLE